MIDVVVIGGYLGAGKTSLVNHLLRQGTGRRTLVLVNDFGSVSVDAELVEARGTDVLTLTNGCVCCSMASPLIDTLAEVRARPDAPELLVIEASGVADPEPLSHHAMIPGFRLSGVLVVADAETVEARSRHELVGRTVLRQLRSAGVVVLNKTDLVEFARVAQLRHWLGEVAPEAAVVAAVDGAVPVDLVVGPSALPRVGVADDDHGHDHNPHLTLTWRPDGAVDRTALLAAFADPTLGVVRAKGVVRFTDRPDRMEMVQVAGQRCNCAPLVGEPDPVLVVIGLPPEFHPERLRHRLDGTLPSAESA